MYLGEVNVAQDDLNIFLTVAEDLKVKGLTQGTSHEPPQHSKQVKLKDKTFPDSGRKPQQIDNSKSSTVLSQLNIENDEVQEVAPVKMEPPEQPTTTGFVQDHSERRYSQQIIQEEQMGTVALDEDYNYQYEEEYETVMDNASNTGNYVNEASSIGSGQ